MFKSQFIRIVAFFLLALLLAGIADFIFQDRQLAITAFGLGVVALSVVMPALYYEMDSPWADAIYYVAAILAAVMFFIANEPEQAVITLRKQISDLKADNTAAQARLAALQSESERNAARIVANADRLREIEEQLAADWARRLDAEEQEATSKLFASLQALEGFATRVAKENAQCESAWDSLALAKAFLDADRDRAGSRLNSPDAVPTPSETLERDMLEAEIYRCSRVGFLQSRIEGLSSGYERVIGLLDLTKDTDLTSSLPGYTGTPFELSEVNRSLIDRISELLQLQRARDLTAVERRRLTGTAGELSIAIAAATTGLDRIAAEIKERKKDLADAENEPLVGFALEVKNRMTFSWPYFLIAFLGLKLAGKALFRLRTAPPG